MEKVIPSEDFDGLGIIDWEAWRPTWEFNWGPFRIYQTKSIEKAREENPNLNDSMIQEIAQQQWELSAKYVLNTDLIVIRVHDLFKFKFLFQYENYPLCSLYS